jgi:hypothetical protein
MLKLSAVLTVVVKFMVTQSLLWQSEQQSSDFAELCNALYERELISLARDKQSTLLGVQAKINSLPHYVKRTAFALLNAHSPLALDVQNASWSAKQASISPSISQLMAYDSNVLSWYRQQVLVHGLVVPIALEQKIVIDCIDRIDIKQQRFRTNIYGWFNLAESDLNDVTTSVNASLLKPTKKVMTAACAGHRWQNSQKVQPSIPSLRELLLSCTINWRNFKQPRTNITHN